MRQLRHSRFGLYGPLVRERFLNALPKDVTPTGYRVLRFIEASSPPPPSLSDVAALLLVDRPRAVRVVDQLTASGLVTRSRDAVDQRIRRIQLTDAGRHHLDMAAARRTRLLGAALSEWSDEDIEQLTAYLIELNDSVVGQLSMPGWSQEEESAT